MPNIYKINIIYLLILFYLINIISNCQAFISLIILLHYISLHFSFSYLKLILLTITLLGLIWCCLAYNEIQNVVLIKLYNESFTYLLS